MKKLLILPMLIAVCAADFGAFAAPRGGGRTGGTSAGSAPAGAPRANGARAAATKKVASPAAAPAAAGAPRANGARAAATKKAINMGTKVAAATENTVIDADCQTAYYGCMDAFCMMDNGSGGRCQCNDKITELDKVLEEIMALDEKSMNLATQGVEKVQMGELASQIDAAAKSLENEFMTDKNAVAAAEAAKTKKKTLDLSAWNNNSLFDVEDEVFDDGTKEPVIENDMSNKKGDELHRAAAKICSAQIPDKCKTGVSLLQQTYAQRVRSDCTGYENALKQQKSASAQKLQQAQRAVREALLDEEKNKNKYEDLGTCVIAFKQCMQTTGECGTDFSGCIADTTILSELYGKSKSASKNKVATTQIKTGATTITISSATYDILNTKALRCESVVRQCQNANGGKTVKGGVVVQEFLKDVAVTVYNTEYRLASDSRMNCMTTVINCVKKSCKSAGMDEGTDNYDACLSNPDSIKNYCGLEIKRCGDVGSENDVISYVQAKLAADRVDKCTDEVKECLTSEDRCGEDYLGCVGMSVNQIVKLCPIDKLLACQEKFDRSDAGLGKANDYIARVIMGLKLQISNGVADRCQEAIDKAMVKLCGAADSCENLTLNNVQYNALSAKACLSGSATCYDSVDQAKQDDVIKGKVVPRLYNRLNLNNISINDDGVFVYNSVNTDASDGYTNENPEDLMNGFNNLLKAKIDELSVDPAVNACINGRDLSEIFPQEKETLDADPNKGKKLSALANGARVIISNKIQSLFAQKYAEEEARVEQEKFEGIYTAIADRLNSIADLKADDFYKAQQKACEDRALSINKTDNSARSAGSWTNDTSSGGVTSGTCSASGGFCELGSQYFFDTWWGRNERRMALYWTVAKYDRETGICTLTKTKYPCLNYDPSPEVCKNWNTTGVKENETKIQLPCL